MRGKIPAGKWVKLACQRQIDDLARSDFPFEFDQAKAEKVCNFIENLTHIKGKWANDPIKLEPWQVFVVTTAFGWVRKSDGLRRFRELYLEVPRKNAKSTLAAALGLYMLAADDEAGAEVYSGATSEKQAWEVFGPARIMANHDSDFREHYGITVNASNIAMVDAAAKFEPVIGKPGDGSSPHCAIIDEYHEHKTPELYDTMITGMGARTQPMIIVITTAGVDLKSPCYDKRGQVIKILEGVIKNDSVFGMVYSIDEEEDWSNFKVWRKANPNFGVSVLEDFLRERHQEAMQRASRQNIIRCKHLNQWMNAGSPYFNILEWQKCSNSDLKIGYFAKKPCWIGVDLASKIDIASVVILFVEAGKYTFFARNYLPEAQLEGADKTHYQGWHKEGWLIVTEGSRIDIDLIEEDILEIGKKHQIKALGIDPWADAMFATHIQKARINLVEIPQNVTQFSAPMKDLDALIRNGEVQHAGDPVFTWAISNVQAKVDKKDNVFPFKETNEAKIDPAVGAIMALNLYNRDKPQTSIYEERDLLVL